MLLITCPWCGPRDESEFGYGGEAHVAPPADSDKASDADWADYLFFRTNPKGVHRERWVHRHGCRRWFNVARHTVSHEILAVYKIGERPPVAGEIKAAAQATAPKRAPRKRAPRKPAPKPPPEDEHTDGAS